MADTRKSSLLDLVPDTLKDIGDNLDIKDISRLARTCKGLNNIFKKPLSDAKADAKVVRLLEYIAHGEQGKAEAMLKKNPKLLLRKGQVTDYSGRTFKDITAFQLAVWYLDRHMWTMIQKYLPQEEAAKQLHEHVYAEKKYKNMHGDYYDFVPLIDALQTYVDNYDAWNDHQCLDHWCKQVGGAQRMVPVHVANEYCHPYRSFDPTPNFNEKKLKRSLEFYDWFYERFSSWVPLSVSPSAGLGSDFAIIRGMRIAHLSCGGWGLAIVPFAYALGKRAADDIRSARGGPDLAAITALCKVRTAELVDLKQQLLIPSHKKSQSENYRIS